MSNPEKPPVPLSVYLQPQISAARLARNREAIRRRLDQPRCFGRLTAGGALSLAAVGAVALVLVSWNLGPWRDTENAGAQATQVHTASAPLAAAATWEPTSHNPLTTEAQPVEASLIDGSRVSLQPFTALAVFDGLAVPSGGTASPPNVVDLDLRKGRAAFDVTHDPQRRFRVHAGGVTVTVLGTRFSVSREAGMVDVEVERGKVAVESNDGTVYLTPGQRWNGRDVSKPDEHVDEQTELQLGGTERQDAGSGARPPQPPAPSAKQLFEASREARRGGHSRRAATLLEQLVSAYPSDPRAALAAFELGRIRMDVLGDTAGAIRVIEQALRLSPRAGFRQDAMARLVQAYDRVGRSGACKAAKRRYLAAYGDGVHARTVLKHCP